MCWIIGDHTIHPPIEGLLPPTGIKPKPKFGLQISWITGACHYTRSKRGNKICGKEEVYRLVNDSLNKDFTREEFELTWNSVTDNHSVNPKVTGKQECLTLPKESCQVSDDTVDQKKMLILQKSLICLNQVSWMILID